MNGRKGLLKFTFVLLIGMLISLSMGVWAGGCALFAQPPSNYTPQIDPPPNSDSPLLWKTRARFYLKNPMVLRARENALYQQQDLWRNKFEQLARAYAKSDSTHDSIVGNLTMRNRSLEDSLHYSRKEADSLKFRLEYVLDSMHLAAFGKPAKAQLANNLYGESDRQQPLYVVQIGAIQRKMRRNRLPNELYSFTIDSTTEMNKYLVGQCNSLQDAKALEAELRGLGLQDAFVTAYQGSERISVRKAQKQGSAVPPVANPQALGTKKETLQEKKEVVPPAKPVLEPTPVSTKDAAQQQKDTTKMAGTGKEEVISQPSEKPVGWEADGGSLQYGFRVQVYSGSKQGAAKIKKEVDGMGLNQATYVVFENPHYKVRVGNYREHKDADILRDRLQRRYGDAYILNDVID